MKDKIGIITSITCLIHCLIFPILGTLFPIFLDLEEPVEVGLLLLALIIGGLSFLENVIKHKYYTSLILFIIGFGFLIGGVYQGEISTWIGLIVLILSHYLNYKNIQKKDGCHPHGCQH